MRSCVSKSDGFADQAELLPAMQQGQWQPTEMKTEDNVHQVWVMVVVKPAARTKSHHGKQ
jgi:hypothetical protein